MKKLMIAAAIVCAAVCVRASSCDWGADSEGWSWSYHDDGKGNVINTYYDGSVGTYWLVALAGSSTTGISVDNKGNLVLGGGVGSVVEGQTGVYDMLDTGATAAGSIEVYAKDNGNYYALVIYDTENGLYGISDAVMMKNVADEPAPNPGDYMKFSNHTGEDFGFEGDTARVMVADTLASGATPTPEPTSGLLLLLGVAGLALRRRRA